MKEIEIMLLKQAVVEWCQDFGNYHGIHLDWLCIAIIDMLKPPPMAGRTE